MAERVIFYQLAEKVVDRKQDTVAGADRLFQYPLAIGHHIGVLDCFQSLVEFPLEEYRQWVAQLPEGKARHKLEGVWRWGEIEINQSHAGELLPVLRDSQSQTGASGSRCAAVLLACLQKMREEPALYLMIRKSA